MAKRGPGRPAEYVGNVRKHIVGLVRKYNAHEARRILNANPRTKLASLRNTKLVPQPLGISLPTILKFAKADGVELRRGRPRKAENQAKAA